MGREATTAIKRIASFEVLSQLGEGGMGVVYLARQPALKRRVVLKKMRDDGVDDAHQVERFQREARAAAAIHHQNVVAVYDCFTVRGSHYIAQEYVDGPDLGAILAHTKRIEPRVAALIALEIARGLEEIHARGIVHRDLKPSNVIIGRGGETKVADFGIAIEDHGESLTRPGTMLGSLPYMSPEQMLGERVDPRSDLFSFGILLYEMLTGVPPFRESGEDATDTLIERMQSGRYVSPGRLVRGVPWYLSRLIWRCLRGKPARRIASAMHARRHLERALGRVSPADCRRQIVEALVQRIDDEATLPNGARGRASRDGRPWRWLVPATALALAIGVVAFQWAEDSRGRSEARPIPPLPPAASENETESGATAVALHLAAAGEVAEPTPAAAVEPARVRFVAYPWAEVAISGHDSFVTPRAAALEVEPGPHSVRFTHPTYGTVEFDVDLAPGEERVIRHRFRRAPAS